MGDSDADSDTDSIIVIGYPRARRCLNMDLLAATMSGANGDEMVENVNTGADLNDDAPSDDSDDPSSSYSDWSWGRTVVQHGIFDDMRGPVGVFQVMDKIIDTIEIDNLPPIFVGGDFARAKHLIDTGNSVRCIIKQSVSVGKPLLRPAELRRGHGGCLHRGWDGCIVRGQDVYVTAHFFYEGGEKEDHLSYIGWGPGWGGPRWEDHFRRDFLFGGIYLGRFVDGVKSIRVGGSAHAIDVKSIKVGSGTHAIECVAGCVVSPTALVFSDTSIHTAVSLSQHRYD